MSKKPVISYFKNGDPTFNYDWVTKLTDINIVHTKKLDDTFNNILLQQKNKIFLHLTINGMGETMLEPEIPSVRKTFLLLKKLIDSGFPHTQILVIVNPIIPNTNGLGAIKLLLRVFTEFRGLRLRYVRFSLLSYTRKTIKKESPRHINGPTITTEEYTVANYHINKRLKDEHKLIVNRDASFFKQYYKLINQYKTIIYVDTGNDALIGTRELKPFGYLNDWKNPITGQIEQLILYDKTYSKTNKNKPISLNIISKQDVLSPTNIVVRQCHNKCVLCPYKTN